MTMNNIWLNIEDDKIDALDVLWYRLYPTVKFCLDKLDISGDSVLDIPCGTGILYPYLSSRFKTYIGFDSSDMMLNRARLKYPHAIFRREDIFNIAADDNSVDVVVCKGVIFHMPISTYPDLIRELKRVAKDRIVLNVRVWEYSTDFIGTWGENLSIIEKRYFESMLKHNGLEIVKVSSHLTDESICGNTYREYYYLVRKA